MPIQKYNKAKDGIILVQTCFSSDLKEFPLTDKEKLLDFIIANTKVNSPVKLFLKDANINNISK
jgi:hypothetical protein